MDGRAAREYASKAFGVSKRSAYRYLRAVLKLHRVSDTKGAPHRRAMHRGALRRRIAKAEHEAEWGAVANMSRLLAQIDGVLEPETSGEEKFVEENLYRLGEWAEPGDESGDGDPDPS